MREVVLTGIGAVTPLGVGAQTLYERWAAGQIGIQDGEGACRDFDPREFLSVKETRRADRFTQLTLVAAAEALTSAGWDSELPFDSTRVGCVIGTGIGGISTIEEGTTILAQRGAEKMPPLFVPLMMPNAAPGAIAMRYGLHGPSYGVVSACAAGSHAIGAALRMIQIGDADAVVTGGTESALTPVSRAGFAALDALSPSGVSRPFDAHRDGFVLGEGAGILVLEAAEVAQARGAEVIARLRGYGASSDAYHLTAPDRDGVGAARAISLALANAGVEPADITYVNAHGTATPLNDRIETLAIKLAFGEHAKELLVSSTKSSVGHLLGAAGAVESVATVLALRNRVAPPTLGWEQAEEGMDLDYVPNVARPLATNGTPPIAISNSFGFGGHNAVLCWEAS